MSDNCAIKLNSICVSYGQNLVLDNVSLTINEGDFLGIMGPNGGGKSTLLKAILGIVPISKGSISINKKPIDKGRLDIGYVPQFSYVERKFPITLEEVVLGGLLKGSLHPFYRFTKEQKQLCLHQMEQLQIQHLAKRQISMLSGGEFQRMLIARALISHPKYLLLDEPTASVDASSRRCIFNILSELNQKKEDKKTILIVTHDMGAISSHIKELACLNTTLVYHGAPSLTQEVVDKLYNCPIDLIAHGVSHRVLQTHQSNSNNCCCE